MKIIAGASGSKRLFTTLIYLESSDAANELQLPACNWKAIVMIKLF